MSDQNSPIMDAKRAVTDQGNGCLELVKCSMPVHLHPSRLGDISRGINEYLNRYLLTYDATLKGVILTYTGVAITTPTGGMFFNQPHISFDTTAKLVLFSPRIGSKLVGVVNKIGRDHIGLLVHGVFNVSITGTGLEGLTHSEEANAWLLEDGSDIIEVGSNVEFEVTALNTADKQLSMVGTIIQSNKSNTAKKTSKTPAKKAKKKKNSQGDRRNHQNSSHQEDQDKKGQNRKEGEQEANQNTQTKKVGEKS